MATVLFVCRQNAGRSQTGQALLERTAEGRHHALSAGTTPAERVHPEVVEVMRELDFDLADRQPQRPHHPARPTTRPRHHHGCGDQCPYLPGKRYIDWELPDPAGHPLEQVRKIRDEIRARVHALVNELDAT